MVLGWVIFGGRMSRTEVGAIRNIGSGGVVIRISCCAMVVSDIMISLSVM